MRLPLLAALVPCSGHRAAEMVALHPGVTQQGIDAERVISILLGRVSCWADGTPAIVVVPLEASADQAMTTLIGRDTGRLLRGWKRLVYAGGAATPTIALSNPETVSLVARLPGAMVLLPAVVSASGCRQVELHQFPH